MRAATSVMSCLVTIMFCSSGPLHCRIQGPLQQDEEEIEEIVELEEFEELPHALTVVERAVNVMFPVPVPKNSLLFILDHRNNQPIRDNTFRDFLGFDAGGLKVGLGLRYGLRDHLDFGLYRLSNGRSENFDVYEFDAKYMFLTQADHYVDMAFRTGVTWFYQPFAEDASGALEQLLISRSLHERIVVGTGLLYHSDSSNDTKKNTDDDYSVAIPASIEVTVTPHLFLNLEVVSNVAGYGAKYPAISSSCKFIVHGHTFSIIFTNTQYTSADGIVSNSEHGFSDTVLGFSITREFEL